MIAGCRTERGRELRAGPGAIDYPPGHPSCLANPGALSSGIHVTTPGGEGLLYLVAFLVVAPFASKNDGE